jgi:hypothetical protein
MEQITLTVNQAGIEKALAAYVNNMGVSTEGKSVSVTLTAGRKGNGFTAEVVIGGQIETVPLAAVVPSKPPVLKQAKAPQPETTPAVELEVEEPSEEIVEEIVEEEAPVASGKKSLFAN